MNKLLQQHSALVVKHLCATLCVGQWVAYCSSSSSWTGGLVPSKLVYSGALGFISVGVTTPAGSRLNELGVTQTASRAGKEVIV